MNTLFPFGFPAPTAFYLTLYVGTLLVHVLFMNYALAGATYLFLASGMGRNACQVCIWQKVLKDWLPFATGLAITAGVAPLLFIQILYQKEFYSANLLLSHRWMSILPVLLVSFYLLYVQKSRWITERGGWATVAVRTGVFAGFAFVAWSWTENHLLSLNESLWPEMYGRGDRMYRTWLLPSRLAMWFCGAFPTLACCLLWQARWTPGLSALGHTPEALRRLVWTGVGGLVCAGVATIVHLALLPPQARTGLFGLLAGPYLLMAGAGAVAQTIGWLQVWRGGLVTTAARWQITAGTTATLVGMTVVREAIRLSSIGSDRLHELPAAAARVGGLVTFLFFLILNAGLIA